MVIEAKLNKAAFYILKGGAYILEITGDHYYEKFKLEISKEMLGFCNRNRLINFEQYMDLRRKLKRRLGDRAGIFNFKKNDLGKSRTIKKIYDR